MTEWAQYTQADYLRLLTAASRNRLPDIDHSEGSDEYLRLAAKSGLMAGLEAFLADVRRNSNPLTAEGTYADGWAILAGTARKGATKASGESVALVRGSTGSSWLTTDVLVHPATGRQYVPTASYTLVSGDAGSKLIGVEAVVAGSAGRLSKDDVLVWESAPAGLEDEVELQASLTGGDDKEKDGALRARYIPLFAEGTAGGKLSDYQKWILESLDDVAFAYVWPHRNGTGSVDIAGLKAGQGSARVLSSSESSAVAAYVNARRPVATGDLRHLDVQTVTQDVRAQILPEDDPQWAKDWEDSDGFTVSSYVAGTRTLTLSADRPASMTVGGRIVIDGTSGRPFEIESLSGTAAVVLVEDFGETISSTEEVWAGGPLTEPVRDAILEHMNGLGPRYGAYGQGAWTSSLTLIGLYRAIGQEGVANSTLDEPVADVEPAAFEYPNDDKVNLIVPGSVIVRYAA